MAFKVRLFPIEPDYETLHVATLRYFPLEKRDYKPYSQVRICFAQDGFHLQFMAFEATPHPESAMCAVLCFDPAKPMLTVTIQADQTVSVLYGMETVADPDRSVHFFTGDDLQGEFWGGNVSIPGAVMKRYFQQFRMARDATFMGNFYKLCKNPESAHYGSFYPADFAKSLESPENLGSFLVIDY